MKINTTRLYLLLPLLVALPATLVYAADAATNWTKMCARCHSKDGSGQAPAGKKLGVKDYRTAEGQKFTDEEALKAILEGTKNAAGKETMPAYKEKMSEDDAKALVTFVRSLEKK